MQTFLCEGRETGAGSRHLPRTRTVRTDPYAPLEQILSDIKQDNKVVFVVLD